MSRFERMLSYVPFFYRSSGLYKGVLEVEGTEFDTLAQKSEELENQFFIDTATWSLPLWEKELGLNSGADLPPEGRRSVIKGKLRGTGKIDAALIKSVAEAYSNGEVAVGFDGNIIVTFIGKKGRPSQLEQIRSQLMEIIPAHLLLKFVFTYLSWNEFDLLSAAVQESMTWDQLEVYTLQEYELQGYKL